MRKNWLYLFVMILMLLGVNYIGQPDDESEAEELPEVSTVGESEVQAEVVDEPVEYTTIEEAQRHVLFEIIIPEYLSQEYVPSMVLLITGNIAEINFYGSEDQIVFRTGQGMGNISGDYTLYDNEENIKCELVTVTAKGNGRRFSLVYFTVDDLKYSISFEQAVTKQEIIDIVDSLPKKTPENAE